MKRYSLQSLLLISTLVVSLFSYSQIQLHFSEKSVAVSQSGIQAASTQPAVAGVSTSSEPTGISVGQAGSTGEVGGSSVEYISPQAYIFDKYFQKNNSPLAGHGKDFVAACEKYGAPKDCTLLIAIAKIETNLCKTGISAKQRNCWGFGGSGPNRIVFPDFATAIDKVTKRLLDGYGATFFTNPSYGAKTYCGAHCNTWGAHVQGERERINKFFVDNGYPALF